jgi:hypothetical protein
MEAMYHVHMDYKGVIIEEGLQNLSVLKDSTILSTKVELVTEKHKTPWLKQWTLRTVEIPEADAEVIAGKISHSLETRGSWYADFKNDRTHFIIFRDKIFKVDRTKQQEYDAATEYGIEQGIPAYQVDFSPGLQEWIL